MEKQAIMRRSSYLCWFESNLSRQYLYKKGKRMKDLYKGKYLIAIYDKNDNFIDVQQRREYLGKRKYQFNRYKGSQYSYHLIDCTEEHDDVFAYEDKVFLEWVKANHKETVREKAKRIGKGWRTIHRYEALLKDKEKCV